MKRLVLICATVLSACAGRQVKETHNHQALSAEQRTAGFNAFYEFLQNGYYKDASAIAKSAGIFLSEDVRNVVTAQMFLIIRRNNGARDGVQEARRLSEMFAFTKNDRIFFARAAFKNLYGEKRYYGAANVAYEFELGEAYINDVIGGVRSSDGLHRAAVLACDFADSAALEDGLIAEDITDLKTKMSANGADDLILHEMFFDLVEKCRLTEAQTRELFDIGEKCAIWLGFKALKRAKSDNRDWDYNTLFHRLFSKALSDKNLNVADDLLESDEFKTTVDDYKALVAKNVELFRCSPALHTALWKGLPDDVIESVLADKKCAGEDFLESLSLVSEDRVMWFFDMALKHQKFALARQIAFKFKMPPDVLSAIEQSALAAKAFDALMKLDPPGDETAEAYRLRMLRIIMDQDEEWFVVRYMVYLRTLNPAGQTAECHEWIERAYVHALFRGEYRLAADIADKDGDIDFRYKGISLAFEGAMKTENAQDAIIIARLGKLGDEALWRATRLELKKRREAARARARAMERPEETGDAGDWKPARHPRN